MDFHILLHSFAAYQYAKMSDLVLKKISARKNGDPRIAVNLTEFCGKISPPLKAHLYTYLLYYPMI